jgi:hypothetical protein
VTQSNFVPFSVWICDDCAKVVRRKYWYAGTLGALACVFTLPFLWSTFWVWGNEDPYVRDNAKMVVGAILAVASVIPVFAGAVVLRSPALLVGKWASEKTRSLHRQGYLTRVDFEKNKEAGRRQRI